MRVYSYVITPEHVHLLVSEPERAILADALKSLKQGVSRRLITNNKVLGGPLKPAVGLRGKSIISGKSGTTISTSAITSSSWKSSATFIAIRSKPGCASVPRTGHGAASATTPQDVRE
jgi:REP element-mobilizing transposase RayT